MTRRLILPTLRGYRASWLRPDVLAGLTLAAIAVPAQMATARLANVPAVAGLYAFLAGSVLFAVLSRGRQVSAGPTPPSPLSSPQVWRRSLYVARRASPISSRSSR